jgi:hypothetical protein
VCPSASIGLTTRLPIQETKGATYNFEKRKTDIPNELKIEGTTSSDTSVFSFLDLSKVKL